MHGGGIFGASLGQYEQAAAGIGQAEGPLQSYDDGVFSAPESMLDGPLQSYRDGSMGQYEQAAAGIGRGWSEEAGEKWLGGMGATSGAMKWCDKANPNSRITSLQKSINSVLRGQKYNPIPEDGLLGPETCGAFVIPESSAYGVKGFPVDLMGEAIVMCDAWTIPTKVGATQPVPPKTTIDPDEYALPWGVRDDRTAKVQNDVNVQLLAHGYQAGPVDGVLGATTCGGMKLADTWGQTWVHVYGKNCKSFPTPAKTGGSTKACPTGTKLVGGKCVVVEKICPSNYVMKNGTCVALAQTCGQNEELVGGKCVPMKKKGAATMWIVGGLAGAAVLTGAYFAFRKKKAA